MSHRRACAVLAIAAVSAAWLAGCATSTIETRKQERYASYAELAPDVRATVDAGQIEVGMPMDAVYIAWGRPSQVVQGQSQEGHLVTWLYHGTYLEEYRYWTVRHDCIGGAYAPTTYLEHDYLPRGFIKGEVIFENGRVRQWRTLPVPPY